MPVGSSAENVRVVCRERTVWRTNKWGQSKRVTVRDCGRIGRGPGYYSYDRPRYAEPRRGGRYYHNGQYYSDPSFLLSVSAKLATIAFPSGGGLQRLSSPFSLIPSTCEPAGC